MRNYFKLFALLIVLAFASCKDGTPPVINSIKVNGVDVNLAVPEIVIGNINTLAVIDVVASDNDNLFEFIATIDTTTLGGQERLYSEALSGTEDFARMNYRFKSIDSLSQIHFFNQPVPVDFTVIDFNLNKTTIKVLFSTEGNCTVCNTCSDGVQNGNETGVDCGGLCPNECPPAPTCDDGIQNGDEAGVDCGGSCPDVCTPTPTCTDGIQNGSETGIDCGGSCDPCQSAPTCTDGIQNGDETGVDCGGSCDPCQATPTCTDGIQNGDETGVDCGGSCDPCQATPTCTDGIQNGDETGVDCGGSCAPCQPDPTCTDGIQNGDETGVDCGGSCAPCSTAVATGTLRFTQNDTVRNYELNTTASNNDNDLHTAAFTENGDFANPNASVVILTIPFTNTVIEGFVLTDEGVAYSLLPGLSSNAVTTNTMDNVEGTFTGTIFNVASPTDTTSISDGTFTVNW